MVLLSTNSFEGRLFFCVLFSFSLFIYCSFSGAIIGLLENSYKSPSNE